LLDIKGDAPRSALSWLVWNSAQALQKESHMRDNHRYPSPGPQ